MNPIQPSRRPLRLSLLAAGLALAAQVPLAQAGEALDIELPSMRTPVVAGSYVDHLPPAVADALGGRAVAPEDEAGMASQASTLSRKQVRDELSPARVAGTLGRDGEISEPPAGLAARAAFNQPQTDEGIAACLAEQHRLAMLQMQAEPVIAVVWIPVIGVEVD